MDTINKINRGFNGLLKKLFSHFLEVIEDGVSKVIT